MLRFHYRVIMQETEGLIWSDSKQHELNWQRDKNMSYLFQQIYSDAINPIKDMQFISEGDRVLEYGCSHAPYYRTYRRYYNHLNVKWTLADLKQISFLYSCYTYYKESSIENLIIIDSDNMDDPLQNIEGSFDVIILTTVLEHVHAPLTVVKMLLSRLKKGGKFVFDYIKSEATGLDSKAGLLERQDTLEYIKNSVDIVRGTFINFEKSIDLCVGIKK